MSSYPSNPNRYPATANRYPSAANRVPGSPNLYPAAAATGFNPASLVAALNAQGSWNVMNIGDNGDLLTDLSGNGRNWVIGGLGAPSILTDSQLGGHTIRDSLGATKNLTNAYDPPSTATATYRVALVRNNSWLGGRCAYAFGTANRRGLLASAVPGRYNLSGNTATGPNIDLPERKWYIVEEYFDGATTNSFVRVGPVEVTGTSVAAIDVASLGMFSSNTGTQPCDSSVALYAEKTGLPTSRAAVRSAITDYFTTGVVTAKSKICRWTYVGDSQCRHDTSYGFRGFRKYIFDYFDTGLQYPTRSLGTSANGTWGIGPSGLGSVSDSYHCGVSGQGLAAADALVTLQFGSGGSMVGAGNLNVVIISCGTVDLAPLSYGGLNDTAANSLARLETLGTNILTRETNCTLALQNLVPFPGDPANFTDYNAGMPTVRNNLEAAFPGRTLPVIDVNSQVNGGVYNDSFYIAPLDQHMNENSSYNLCGPTIVAALASTFNSVTM